MYADAADVGFGYTLSTDSLEADKFGMWCDQAMWSLRERAESITFRDLNAVRLLLERKLGEATTAHDLKHLRLWCDNQTAVHVTNSFVSASQSLMQDLHRLRVTLPALYIQVKAEWLPSVVKQYADVLSRRFDRDDVTIWWQLLRSVVDGTQAARGGLVYPPLSEHPYFV